MSPIPPRMMCSKHQLLVFESQILQQSDIRGRRFSPTAVSCQGPLRQSNGNGSRRNLGALGAASQNTVRTLEGESMASGRGAWWLRAPPINHSTVGVPGCFLPPFISSPSAHEPVRRPCTASCSHSHVCLMSRGSVDASDRLCTVQPGSPVAG